MVGGAPWPAGTTASSSILMKQPLGVILAGGGATRMGGGDKSLLPLGQGTILSHVIDRLDPQVDGWVLNANGDPTRFNLSQAVIADSITDAGPLSGVLSGLDHATEHGHTHIITAAADTPFFPCDLVPNLMLHANNGLCLAASPSGLQPTFGLWPVALSDDLRKALNSGLRKILHWTDSHQAGTALFPDDDAFFNVNTPADHSRAKAML